MECYDYLSSGVCRAKVLYGNCHYTHDENSSGKPELKDNDRCEICTLLLPCCSHSPPLGEALCNNCERVMSNSECGEFKRREVVGVLLRKSDNNCVTYAIVEEDKPNIERVVVWTKTQNNFTKQVSLSCQTVNRKNVYKIRKQLNYHLNRKLT